MSYQVILRTFNGTLQENYRCTSQQAAKQAFEKLVNDASHDGQKLVASVSYKNTLIASHRYDRQPGDAQYWRDKLNEVEWPPSLGRPAELQGGKRMNVYLDAESLARASSLSQGNVSEGIRVALAQVPAGSMKDDPKQLDMVRRYESRTQPLYPRMVEEPSIAEGIERAAKAACEELETLLPPGVPAETGGIGSNFQGTLEAHIAAMLQGRLGAAVRHSRPINALFGSEDCFGRLYTANPSEGYTVVLNPRKLGEEPLYFHDEKQAFVPLQKMSVTELFTSQKAAVNAVFAWLQKEERSPREEDFRLCILSFQGDGPLTVTATA